MRKIAAVLIAAAAALALLGIVISAATPRYPTTSEIAAERLAVERMEAVQPAATLAATILTLLPAAAGIVALVLLSAWAVAALSRFRRRELVRADASGRLPVLLDQLPSTAPAALGAYHAAQLAAAQRPGPLAHTYSPQTTYSPHSAPRFDYRGDTSRDALPALTEPPALAGPALPGLTDLADVDHRPTLHSILLALGPGGHPITVAARDLCHVALCGATGQGKSNIMRLILPQLQAMGAQVVLADPHYAPVDPDSGDDWRLIAGRLHLAPAQSTHEIAALLRWLASELERRKTARRDGQMGAPLFFAFDELPVIIEEVEGAADLIGAILREGRKFRMYTVGASQEFLVKTIGGSSALRDCYRTAAYVGGDLKSASALLDMRQADIAEHEAELGGGIVYLRSKATAPAALVRVPYASNRAIKGLLGDGQGAMVDLGRHTRGDDPVYERTVGEADHVPHIYHPSATSGAADSAPQSAEAAQVAALFAQGLDIAQIVLQLRGVRGNQGKRYQDAAAEVQALLRAAWNRSTEANR